MRREIIRTVIIAFLTEIMILLLGKEICEKGMLLAGCLYMAIFTVIIGISAMCEIDKWI